MESGSTRVSSPAPSSAMCHCHRLPPCCLLEHMDGAARVCMCLCVFVYCARTCVHVCRYALPVCIHVHICACLVFLCTSLCMYVHAYVYVCVCARVCTCVARTECSFFSCVSIHLRPQIPGIIFADMCISPYVVVRHSQDFEMWLSEQVRNASHGW